MVWSSLVNGGSLAVRRPVDLAEHYIASKDHHLGSRSSFVADRQTVTGLIQAQAADQTLLIEISPVRHAGMQSSR